MASSTGEIGLRRKCSVRIVSPPTKVAARIANAGPAKAAGAGGHGGGRGSPFAHQGQQRQRDGSGAERAMDKAR